MMRKLFFFLILYGSLAGCVGHSEPSRQLRQHEIGNRFLLWSETLENGTHSIELNNNIVTFVTSYDDRRKERSVEKQPNDPVVVISGSTLSSDDHQMQIVLAVVIIDEALAANTAQIEFINENNQVLTQPNKSGKGALFFIEPDRSDPEQIGGDGEIVRIIGDPEGESFLCYHLRDEDGVLLYSKQLSHPYLSPDDVPLCQQVAG